MSALPMPTGGGLPPSLGGAAGALPPSLAGGPKPALPPSLQASSRTGNMTTPSPHQGAAASGMVAVQNAVTMLQDSLSKIPMGTEFHTAVAKAIVDISKHMRPEDKDQGLNIGGLAQTIKAQAKAGPQNAIARLFPQGPQAPAMQPDEPPELPPGAGVGATGG